ncbi:hypothetical protein DB347_23215 [Opitutaceae bacterium EW11]|nr:hypothetical protein DB347_23215 [Opitutaceae bacterium EW11]
MNSPISSDSEAAASPTSGVAPLLSRRDFLQRMATGIVVVVALRDAELFGAEEPTRPVANRQGLPTDFNAFLRIGEDGRITCFTGKIEMGQGPITSLPQMLADELEAPIDAIDIVMGDTELCPYDAGTWGSLTTRAFGPAWRAAAAEAKLVLIELASEALGVPVAQLVAKDGAVFDPKNPSRRKTYGQLSQGKRIERKVTVKPTLKEPSQFAIMGKPMLRRDAREKVTGQAKYSGDIRLPGMLYARILHPPAHGAKRISLDTSAAKQIPGAIVLVDGDLVAVLHELPDIAESALGEIKAEWDLPKTGVNDRTIFDHLLKTAAPGRVVKKDGDLETGRKQAKRILAANYLNGYVAHAPIETHTALASFENGKMTVWASTQSPFGAQREISQTLGLPLEKVRVITPFVGGGFGGKAANGQAVEAARLARLAGKPVQVMWTREEEFFNDTFRPAAVVKIEAGLDDAGRIAFWDFDEYFASERGADHFYDIPHHRTQTHTNGPTGAPGTHPFATGAWRAPGNNTNSFARESHIDALAIAAGMDPVEFRLKHLEDERMIRVLKAAAERFGWKPAVGPSGRGYGVACGIDAGSYVAAIAEVEVDRTKGTVQVKRVVCAQDMGIVINPQGATIQMESCITMGLGYCLTEELHFSDGAMTDTNFDSYEIPRFSWIPKMETVIVENNALAPQGGGEPAIVLMGGLIANAVHDAIGARLLQLPMTPARIREALQSAPATKPS